MSEDVLKKQLEALRAARLSKNTVACLQIISVINEYFDLPKSTNETKYAVELLFKDSDKKIDLQKFIISAFHGKDLHECAIRIYEAIHKVIAMHSAYVRPFSKNLTEVGLECLKYADTSARFKEMAVKTIAELIQQDILNEDVNLEVITRLMSVLNQDVKNRLFSDIYELLGTISSKYPEKFTYQKGLELRNRMMTCIQKLFKDDKATYSLVLVAGAIKGLRNHLKNFAPSEEEHDEEFKIKLYECMLELSDPNKHPNISAQSSRVVFRNMLEVVHDYAHLVSDQLFKDYLRWQKVLLMWLNSTAYEDKNVGLFAIYTFHREIAANLERRKSDIDKPVLLYFMNFFQKTLELPKSEPHEIRVAIRGFGSMAVACKILLEPKYLSERFDLVMQRTEYSYYVGDKVRRREVLEHLPSYIEALSKIMNQLDEISGIQLHSLQSVLVILIKDFHFLSTSHHILVAFGLLETFLNLQKSGGKILDDVLESVIWQGILWTCSHQLTYDLQENIGNIKDWKETITYKRYLPLWRLILTPEDEKYELISSKIYEHFIKNLFLIIDKLDLSTKKRKYHDDATDGEIEFYFTDPSLDLEPVRAENFQILYNLVQFYQDVLTEQSNQQLEKYFVEWMELWIEKSIQLSYKHSLISAFMHFIEISLNIMERVNYTQDSNDIINKHKTIETLKSFIRTLFPRCLQISGELQVACLQLVFKTPAFILIDHVNEMINILIIGFTVGKSVLSLAHHALNCFEALVQELNNDTKARRNLLEKVLPCLESFLSTSKELTMETELKVLKYRKQKNKAIVQNIETDLMKLKKRIFLFLGTCSPNEAQLILSDFQQKLIKDYVTNIFKIKLDCDDAINPLIYLDQIMERVCHLSIYSSDRSTKVSASELLHGLVLYIMGKNLERTESLPMWRNLCKTIIILGADKDETVRQLFEPLLMQMIHFYSQPNKILSPLSSVLMESVMEMMSYKESGIQDLSARLLREYILWLMRQTNRDQRKTSPVRLVDFFCELRKLSMDADQSKRLAATLGFNNIYRIVREEESLVDVYWIYLLDIFCMNFRSTEDFSENLDIYFVDARRFEQISATLDHLTRVFVERSTIFHQVNNKRIVPINFGGMTLRDVLNFLFEQCASPQYYYRHKCMEIFSKIQAEYNTKEFYYNENWSVEKILKIGDGSTGISKYPDLKHLNDTKEPIYKETYKWLCSLLSALEFYHWIFKNEFIPAEEIENFLSTTVVINSVEFFLKSIALNDMIDLLRSINENLLNSTQASMELKMHNRNLEKIDVIKNLILVTLLDFLSVLVKQHNIEDILLNNKDELIKVVKTLVFKPQRLNFDYKVINIIPNYRERLIHFVKTVNEHSSGFSQSLVSTLQNKVMKYFNEFCQTCEKILTSKSATTSDENKLIGIDLMISHLYNQIDTSNLAHDLIYKSAETLLMKIFDSIVEKIDFVKRPRHLTPNLKKFATSLVKMCLKIDPLLLKVATFSFNNEELKVSETCTIQKGELFLQTFKMPIFEVFTTTIRDTIELFVAQLDDTTEQNRLRIFNILAEINEYIYSHHNQNQKLLEDNFKVMTMSWMPIMECFTKMDNNLNCVDLTVINLVTHIAMTCPHELITLSQRFQNFKNWLLTLFQTKTNSFEIKSKGIFLLPCITNSNDKANEELMNSLLDIQRKHLPLKSAEFPEGSLERSSLVTFTKSIFQALLTSKSPVIYRFLLTITVNDEKHILEEKLQAVQIQLMKSLTDNEQEAFLSQTFEAFMNESFDCEIRLNIVKRFLLTILKSSNSDAILSFIKQKMSQIFLLIDSKFDIDPENAFVNRSAGFMIIEAFAAAVPKDKIESSTYSYNGNINNGLALIKELILKAKDVRRDVVFMVEDRVLQELFRKFQCYCYRALASLVANTKDAPEIFNLCLFQENSRTSTYIWRKLIDIRDENIYSDWKQDFEEFPKIKQYIVSIKDMEVNAAGSAIAKKYINTISIFDKSLSQTLTKTDLSYSVVLSNRELLEKSEKEQQRNMQISLESIPINEHEIMGTLIGAINLLFTKKLTIFSNFEQAEKKKYEWVISLANSLKTTDQHKNVKIFLAKLIENCRIIFSHYAQFLLGPILSVLTDGTCGDAMSFFITDLVTMLLSWSNVYKPKEIEEINDAGQLLKFLMTNAYHERNEIFKMNLELIKKLIETWNETLGGKIPTQILLDMLQKPMQENQNSKLICGIQINAVVLANNLTPWDNDEQCNLFVKAILSTFSNESPKIYQASAQLMGLCLNIIEKRNENDIDHAGKVKDKLEALQSQRAKSDIFFQLLYGIQKEYPSILDTFMSRIASAIPLAIRKTKCIYMEMFLARLEIFKESMFMEVSAINIRYLLKQNEYQLLALHIINKAIEFLSADEFMRIFDDLSYLTTSQNDEVKHILYEIMIFSISKYGNAPTFDKQKPMKIILKGFNDVNPEIQKRVVNFFNENSGLSKSFKDRFQELLTVYYEPQLEREFLHYATQLLLEIPIHHPRSNRALLDYDQRSNTDFFEYPITTSTSSQRSLPPMFIQSQQRRLLAGDGSQFNELIRATQLNSGDQIFAPTLDPSKLSQVSQTFSLKQTQNSLFVSLKPQYLSLRSQLTSEVNELENMQMPKSNHNGTDDSLDYLRQRIVKKTSDQTSRHYALRAIERRDFKEASRINRVNKLKQGKEVVLYRRYRLGDFPDFFFNSLAILMPLQALAKKDDLIARHVFVSIFESIVKTFDESHDEGTKDEFYVAINEAIVFSLKNTVECNPLFLGTLIELVNLSEKYLDISPSIIKNSMSVTGILFLESQLLRLTKEKEISRNEVQPVKRIKIDDDEVQAQHWMKLIELYYRINEYEVVNGIFTEKFRLDSTVKIDLLRAIDLEINSQYRDAFDIYQKLIQQNAHRSRNEKDFYYNSYFNCLSHLSDWEQVTHGVQSQFNSYEEIWDERVPFHQNTLLPLLVKGELLKILNGDVNEGFLSVMEDWFEDDAKNDYLHKKFPEEIGMLNIIEENYAACCVDMDKVLQTLSDEWGTLEMRQDKLQLLQSCRNIAEITNFVDLMTLSEQTSVYNQIEKLVQSWRLSVPTTTDSLILWNDLVAYRKHFLPDLTEKYKVDNETRQTSEGYIIDIERNLLNVAFKQNNLDAAKYFIAKLKSQMKNSTRDNIFKYNLALGKFTKMKAEKIHAMNNINLMVGLGNAWEKLKTGVLNQDVANCVQLEIEALSTTSEIAWKVFKLYQKVDEDLLTNEVKEGFMSIMDLMVDEESNVAEEVLKYAESALKSARHLAQKSVDEDYSPEKELVVGYTYLKIGQFYRNVFIDELDESSELQLKLIQSMFRAISYGSDEARMYIPYILQLPAFRNNIITNEFNELLRLVPEWMFLPYISQIVSSFDFENDCSLDHLLMKLAKMYPNALYYSFNLSRANFHYIHEDQVMEKPLINEINELVSNRSIDNFSAALQCLVVPLKLLQVHINNFTSELSLIETNKDYKVAATKMYENIFVQHKALKGTEFSKLAIEFEERIKKLITLNWQKNRKDAMDKISQIKKLVDEKLKKNRPAFIELRKLCPWLADYKWSGETNFLEIPGQYSGNSKPFIESHVKIVRFEQNIKIFSSKQLPIELKIYGNDGKAYNFIIKYGEDLRQDQRIQQTLKIMSDKLLLDKNCTQNNLKIDTYEVIPINSTCGILQIVNNAATIADFMQEISKQFMVKKFHEMIDEIRGDFQRFLIGDDVMLNGYGQLYEKAVVNMDREELVKKFKECEEQLPDEILYRSLQKMSVTLEAYYVLRKNFITSLAAMNIAHYLLSIGDRHLSNILLDMKTGRLIGIDFGIAFGNALALGVAELVPFRLSSHFVKVMEPMGINGLIKKNMMHTLKCLRNNKEAILIFLEVFIKEPTIDWLFSSKMKNAGNLENHEDKASDWNPEKRIDIVRRKIDGENPTKILIEELSSGGQKSNEALYNGYVSMINGDENSIRRKFKDSPSGEILTVDDQTTCLIELATDKAILACTYLGWDPWF